MSPLPSPVAALPAETAAMRALLAVLEREQACLSAGDADGCAALLDDKAVQVGALTALAAQRHRTLASLGFAADEAGMTAWLRASSDGAPADWQALMAATREAHEINRVNGVLLAQLGARNRQALDALGVRASGGGIYGPGGQTAYAPPRATRVIG